ncbi:MAG: fructose-1,6-bisphosphatase/inositol monophosphatase family enzyme [Candidatus Deianiraeaceae bacterium]|jgi:fructose-1,6-bisphosphatase/inositol monophosphatase family enzyme
MLYHPIANALIQVLEEKISRYTKDLYEISHLQASTGAAERFASISVSTFTKSIQEEISQSFKGTLYISTLLATLEENSLGEKPLKLLFNPIDNFRNFSRGIPNFGVSFLLQEETDMGWVDVFSIVYSYHTQEVMYTDAVGSYIRGRMFKPTIRKHLKLAMLSCNTRAIKFNPNIVNKFQNLRVTNSIIDDFHLLARGKVDTIYFEKEPIVYLLPLLSVAKVFRVNNEEMQHIVVNKDVSSKSMTVLFTNKYLRSAITDDK